MKQKKLYTVTVREQFMDDNGTHITQVVVRVVNEEALQWYKLRPMLAQSNWEQHDMLCYREAEYDEREWLKKQKLNNNVLRILS